MLTGHLSPGFKELPRKQLRDDISSSMPQVLYDVISTQELHSAFKNKT